VAGLGGNKGWCRNPCLLKTPNWRAKISSIASGPVHYRVDREVKRPTFYEPFRSITKRAPVPEHSYVADYFELNRADADVVSDFWKG